MANETTERVLESRIQLRNDTAENWRTADPKIGRASCRDRVYEAV